MTTQISDADFIDNPDNWPNWPFLPVKNYHLDSYITCGFLCCTQEFAEGRRTIYLGNIFGLKTGWSTDLPTVQYQNTQEMIDAKWVVD